jgi:hypothetical protein
MDMVGMEIVIIILFSMGYEYYIVSGTHIVWLGVLYAGVNRSVMFQHEYVKNNEGVDL